MAPRKSTRGRATPRSRKAPNVPVDDQTTPPTSPAVAVPATPRPKRVSPRKLEVSPDAPAVQISATIHTPPVSRRLSFGTAVEAMVDAPMPSQTGSSMESDKAPALADEEELPVMPDLASELVHAAPIAGAAVVSVPFVEDDSCVHVEGTPTPKGKRKRAVSTVSPSPSAKPLVVGAKKPQMLSPDELKAARQANPAKRIRPIARIDSDDEGTGSAPRADSPVPLAFEGSHEDTPRPPPPRLVMLFLDDQAEEDNSIEADDEIATAWCSPSPSPQRAPPPQPVDRVAETFRLKAVERAKQKAKALMKEAEDIVANSALLTASDFAKERSGRSNDPILLDESDDEFAPGAGANTGNGALSFPEIPPLFTGILSALKSLKILQHLKYSELIPKFTPQGSEEAQVPDVLHVMGCMVDEYAAVAIYDALLFQGRGVYVNPLIANPRDFRIVNKTVMFASESRSPAVFVMPIVVETCSLLDMVSVNPYDQHLRLTGWLFDEVFGLFSCFIGSLLNLDSVYAYMNNYSLQFSSRLQVQRSDDARSGASAPNTPQRSSMSSMAFKPAGSSRNKARQAAPSTAMTIRYPSSLGPTDTIPIYDGRLNRGNFRFTPQDWDQLPSMIRYGVPMPALNELADNSRAQELPSCRPDKFVVALVGFTMSTFKPKDNPAATVVSFNLQFSVVLGAFRSLTEPRKVTQEYIDHVRNRV